MKKLRILLYKTPWQLKLKYLVNHLISIRTLSKYSHIETWVPDVNGNFIEVVPQGNPQFSDCPPPIKRYAGTAYTSTMRGEDSGTVKRDASKVLIHPANWDFIEIEVTEKQYEVLIWWLDMKVSANKGYSKRDIMKFLVPIHFDDYQREICSELINDGLVVIQVILGFGIFSPGKVAKKLIKQGNKVKSLI